VPIILYENEIFSSATHFDMNGRVSVLALIERLKATGNWAIAI